jgi:hypothetical protein
MPLLDDTVHVDRETGDVDRLVGFYARVLDADVLFVEEEPCARRVGIRLDRATVLHSVERTCDEGAGDEVPAGDVSLDTGSPRAFLEVRDRLVEAGASDGVVRDSGTAYSVTFVDPDGVEVQVNLVKRDAGSDWRIVDEAELLHSGVPRP